MKPGGFFLLAINRDILMLDLGDAFDGKSFISTKLNMQTKLII